MTFDGARRTSRRGPDDPAPAASGHSQPSVSQIAIAAVCLGRLIVVSWFWPLIIYVGDESEAVHLDEGFLVDSCCWFPST